MEKSTTANSESQEIALKSDQTQAKQFLSALDPDPDAIYAFQTFDDTETKDRNLAATRSGKFLELAALLVNLNRRRIGVFVTINKTDGGGRQTENITGLRALFIDHDFKDGPLKKSIALATSAVVGSGGGDHYYWFLKPGEDISKFNSSQQHLAKCYGTDAAVSDLPRVMRLPGFIHHKGKPIQVRIKELNPDRRYTIDEILKAHRCNDQETKPDTEKNSKKSNDRERDNKEYPPADSQKIRAGCSFIEHCFADAEELSEPDWLVGLGIIGRCKGGEELAHEMSSPHPEYDEDKTQDKLDRALEYGPWTCALIESKLQWAGCVTCPNRDRVRSPIVLGAKPIVKLMTEAEALPIVEAAIAALKAEKPDAKPLFKKHAFEAFAALNEEKRDEFILEVRELRVSSKKLKDLISLAYFNDRVAKAVRNRHRAKADQKRVAAQAKSGRPTIEVDGQLRDISDAAFKALVSANNPPVLMAHGGAIVRVILDEKRRPKIERLTHAQLKRILSRVADFMEANGDSAWPPSTVVQDVLESGEWPGLPALAGITTVPILRPDGTFHKLPGLDPVTGWYYSPPEGFVLPETSDKPTDDELAEAVRILWEPFHEFPFVDGSSWANLVAFILTVFLRPAIDGNVVLFIFAANMQGTGKSLMLMLAAMIALGIEEGEVFPPTDCEEEMRKRITTALKNGLPLVTIDNLEKRLNSQALSTLLTTRNWRDRFLGTNESVSLPNNAVWSVTGNNPRIGDDTLRRSCLIELRAEKEKPWEGREFTHKKIVQWVREHRGELLGAVLTIVRAWFSRGCPEAPGLRRLGHFEIWSEMIGGMLHLARIDGFMGNSEKLREMNDGDSVQWRGFLSTWFNLFLDLPMTISTVCNMAAEPARTNYGGVTDDYRGLALREALPQYLAPHTKHSGELRHRLGNAFKYILGAPYGNFMLEKVGMNDTTNTVEWRVKASDLSMLPIRTRNAYKVIQWLREAKWVGDALEQTTERELVEKFVSPDGVLKKDEGIDFSDQPTQSDMLALERWLLLGTVGKEQVASICRQLKSHFVQNGGAGTEVCPGAVPAPVPETVSQIKRKD